MTTSKRRMSRRTLFAGAGTAGALATAATLVPHALRQEPPAPTPAAPAPSRGGGYHVSEHVLKYLRSTRI